MHVDLYLLDVWVEEELQRFKKILEHVNQIILL